MDIYIVMVDLGDGDVGLCYFPTYEIACEYIENHHDRCHYESNPRHIKVDNTFKFNKVD